MRWERDNRVKEKKRGLRAGGTQKRGATAALEHEKRKKGCLFALQEHKEIGEVEARDQKKRRKGKCSRWAKQRKR